MTSTDRKTFSISVIIPTLNEEDNLDRLLKWLQGRPGIEIIVVDGGSADQTVACARRHGVQLIQTEPGRGGQLNRGAELATREVLLFLHADTLLPDNFADQMHAVLALPQTAAGAFRLKIDARGTGYRCIEWGANLRSRFLQMPYGDQAIFVRNSVLRQAGGVPPQPIMEDVALLRRLKRFGSIRIAPATVITSARRWQSLGLIRTTLRNQLMLLGAACGLQPHTLRRFYTGQNGKGRDRQ
ncbi:MAG TPA: glycosyltransferase [Desulfobulbaceae bacterium]|nr:glycosyltransferase [Desulfobulbaceae bacterium]